jgi:hypothetical protein
VDRPNVVPTAAANWQHSRHGGGGARQEPPPEIVRKRGFGAHGIGDAADVPVLNIALAVPVITYDYNVSRKNLGKTTNTTQENNNLRFFSLSFL